MYIIKVFSLYRLYNMNLNYNLNNTQVICCLSLLILVALLISCNNNNNNGFMEGYTNKVNYGKLNSQYCSTSSSPLYIDISSIHVDLSGIPSDITTDISFQEWIINTSNDGYILNTDGKIQTLNFKPHLPYNVIYSCEYNPKFIPGGSVYINTLPTGATMVKYVVPASTTTGPASTTTGPASTTTGPASTGTVIPITSSATAISNANNGIMGSNDITNIQNQSYTGSNAYPSSSLPGSGQLNTSLNNLLANNNNNNNNSYNQGTDNNQFGNYQYGNNQYGTNTSQYPYDNDNDNLNVLNAVSRGFNNTFGQNNGNPLNLFGLMGGANDISSPSNIFTTSDGRQGIANTQNTIKGIPSSQIPSGQHDLYILKSQVVPPVCPACPPVYLDKKELGKECPPCPACARCPEPSFDCKKVPNYELGPQNTFLPRPVLNNFSTFGT